ATMSVWTAEGAIPVRRSSRRMSVTPSDVESFTSALSTPRKLMHPKSSMIPRLKEIEEKMASSDDELSFAPATEPKRRGRPAGRKSASPARVGRPKMTAIKTPASSAAAVKDAAAAAAATVTPSVRKERTPPRSRSSSRTRKAASVGAAAATPAASPAKQPAPMKAVLNFDDSPMIMTRRSTRLAKTPSTAATNGHAANGTATKKRIVLERVSTEQWRDDFTEKHPIFTKMFIPAMICLVYALVIFGLGYYFDVHNKAPVWMDLAAKSVNDMYDDFMASRAASSPAAAAGDQI
ncbi:hypothetical protein PMAYCL1PPCAC_04088, partial [Pristionchus mayeri]